MINQSVVNIFSNKHQNDIRPAKYMFVVPPPVRMEGKVASKSRPCWGRYLYAVRQGVHQSDLDWPLGACPHTTTLIVRFSLAEGPLLRDKADDSPVYLCSGSIPNNTAIKFFYASF